MSSNNQEQEANPWQTLSTISNFDRDCSNKTRGLDEANDGGAGGQVVGRVAPSTSFLIESLLKSLCAMFEPDSRRRNRLYYLLCDKLYEMRLIDGSYNMMEFESIRGEYQQAWFKMVRVARAAAGSENIVDSPSFPPSSRYSMEFNETGFIASGGFGSVYRAKNYLDGHEYAIKKIVVRVNRLKSLCQQLKEVKTLAKLNHTNIVAYKGAWIEYNLPSNWNSNGSNEASSQQSEEHSQTSSVIFAESNSHDSYSKSYKSKISSSSNCSHNEGSKSHSGRRIVDSGSGESSENQNSDVVSFRNEDSDNNDASVSSDSNDIEEIEEDGLEIANESNNGRLCPYDPSVVRSQYATLYIQMSLCGQNLRVWMDERREATPEPITTTILKQILDGIHYMHSRGVVHHDIKPSNIFIAGSGERIEIQVGDFGLACPLQRESHDPILATEMYVAPEQLDGQCNFKSDLYSLGIVAFEILFPMHTAMERHNSVKNLKIGKMPENFIAQCPKWAEIIKKLVHTDPDRRPSTSDLLREFEHDKDSIIATLESSNREKDIIIENMSTAQQGLRKENDELRKKLKKLEDYIKSLKGTPNVP